MKLFKTSTKAKLKKTFASHRVFAVKTVGSLLNQETRIKKQDKLPTEHPAAVDHGLWTVDYCPLPTAL
ncbi:hypothetical protein SAMN03080617_02606, partial [Algoriphagus alkaliphilus]